MCYRCSGDGKHVNPSIDGHGITMDEWWGPDWDDESREMYMNGGYDVTCSVCDGRRVNLVFDREALKRKDPDLLRRYEKWLDDETMYQRICEAERRMGA